MAFRDPFDPDFRRGAYEGPVEGGDAILKPEASGAFPNPYEREKHSEATSMPEKKAEEKGKKEHLAGENGEAKDKAADKPKGKHSNEVTDKATKKAAAEAVEKAESQAQQDPDKKQALANLKVKNGHGPKDNGKDAAEKSPLTAIVLQYANAKEKPENKAKKAEDKAEEVAKHDAEKKGDEEQKAASAPSASPKSEVKKENNSSEEGEEKKRILMIEEETREIKEAFKKALEASGLLSIPYISLEATKDGVLISLTDRMDFEMFAIASAEPRPEVVVVMEQLARILAKQKGGIIIRGHTDSRPFRSKTYDNWRLSSARAHMTYFMLVRGGVFKSRVERIEGYADRDPKIPSNTRAAANRRIEILLRPPET
jgi:chemotaxis protein MotB